FVGLALANTMLGSNVPRRKLSGAGLWLFWISAALGAWFVVAQFRLGLLGDQLTLATIENLVWSSAPTAALAVIVLYGLSRLTRATALARQPAWTLLGLCALAVGHQGVWHVRMLKGATHEAQRFSGELADALSADAVLVGPYATNFTMDNRHRCLIYFFGVDKIEPDLFRRFPVTHIAADQPNLEFCHEQFPLSRSAVEVARLDIRESSVKVVRLNRSGSTLSPLTALERAAFFAVDSLNDSALVYTRRFERDHPQSALAVRNELERLLVAGGDREAVDCARRLVALDRDGAWSHALAARGLTYLSRKYRDPALQAEAETNLRRATQLNPAATGFFTRFAHMQ
ncbi:MAG TPA: hypothetical protein VLB27_08925, partial [candidate division Zixibacteria bacterium]|nr:hypothetical protein [candidate division Zixibacteria bacterium]